MSGSLPSLQDLVQFSAPVYGLYRFGRQRQTFNLAVFNGQFPWFRSGDLVR